MKKVTLFLLGMVITIVTTTAASAGTLIFSESTFLSDIQPGYYLEDFSSYTYGSFSGSSLPLSQGAFSFIISGNLLSVNSAMSVHKFNDIMVAQYQGGGSVVGGQFFPTDISGNDTNGDISLNINFFDGSVINQRITMHDLIRPFFGYSVSPGESLIIGLVISSLSSEFPTIDHLYVGNQVVPLPGAFILLGSGLGLLAIYRRKKLTDKN